MFFLHKKFASWRRFSIWSVFVKCVFEPLNWYGKDREIHKHIPAILEPPKRSHTCDVKKPCYSCDVYIYFPYQLVIYIAGIVPLTVFRPKFLHHPFKRFYKGGWRLLKKKKTQIVNRALRPFSWANRSFFSFHFYAVAHWIHWIPMAPYGKRPPFSEPLWFEERVEKTRGVGWRQR